MPLNQLKKYNDLLDINGMSPLQRKTSLKGIFNRDITNNCNFKFKETNYTDTKRWGNSNGNIICPFNNYCSSL